MSPSPLIGLISHLPSCSFVQIESTETKLYIDRSGRSTRSDRLFPITLLIPREHEGESVVLNCKGSVHYRRIMSDSIAAGSTDIILSLGQNLTVSRRPVSGTNTVLIIISRWKLLRNVALFSTVQCRMPCPLWTERNE